uniref:Uncharacterized protein n=1 Tax=Anguilla anguilla TaxID=7936 RepID=A0A0E9SAF2_ANGAN
MADPASLVFGKARRRLSPAVRSGARC